MTTPKLYSREDNMDPGTVVIVIATLQSHKYTKTRSLPRQTNYTNLIQNLNTSIANVIMQESYS